MSQEQILRPLLEAIAEKENYKDYKLIISEVSSGGANYTSKLFTITVQENEKEDLHLFAKVACMSGKFRGENKEKGSIKIYMTEKFFYTELAKIYKNIEDDCNVAEADRLCFAKCYGYDNTVYKETIILEDLVSKGFEPYDRFKAIDWPYASGAIKEMVKFHALSYAFAEKDPVKYKQVVKDLNFDYEEILDGMVKNSSNTALKCVTQENKEALKQILDDYTNFFQNSLKVVKRPTITHGDFRPSNLMHKVKEDGTVDIKIVDLQTMQCSSPILDLLYFIFTGSDEKFRAQYYDQLIDHYYTQLHAAMKRLHLDPEKVFTRADFDNELKEKLPLGLIISIFSLPIITVEEENAPKVDEDLDLSSFSVEKTSDLYTERLNGVVNDYVKWGILKLK